MMPRTEINLPYVCAMPCNMCWSCRQPVHLFIAVISPGDRCKAWPGVRLCPPSVTAWETPRRRLILCNQWRGRKNRASDISWSLLWFHFTVSRVAGSRAQGRVKSSEHCALVTSTHSPCSSSLCTQGWVGTAPREAEIPSPSQKKDFRAAPLLGADGMGRRVKQKKLHEEDFDWETTKLYFLPSKKRWVFFPQPPSKFTLPKHRPFQKKKKSEEE